MVQTPSEVDATGLGAKLEGTRGGLGEVTVLVANGWDVGCPWVSRLVGILCKVCKQKFARTETTTSGKRKTDSSGPRLLYQRGGRHLSDS